MARARRRHLYACKEKYKRDQVRHLAVDVHAEQREPPVLTISGATARSPHTHWLVRRTTNPLFTGRQDLLHELEETIRDAIYCPWNRSTCRIVISGMGGQGKSEVCLQLARRLRHM